jgi:hypothetical protein
MGGSVVTVVEVVTKFAAVARNPCFVPADIVPIPPIAIIRKGGSRAQRQKQ